MKHEAFKREAESDFFLDRTVIDPTNPVGVRIKISECLVDQPRPSAPTGPHTHTHTHTRTHPASFFRLLAQWAPSSRAIQAGSFRVDESDKPTATHVALN